MTTLNMFRHSTDVRTIAAGETLFAQGDPGDVMYVVQQGTIEITVGDTVIDTAGPGGIVGEMALIDHAPRSATAIARTDCTIVPVNEQHFTYLVQQTPHFALVVMRIMTERLRRLMAR